ncbi:two-component system sensor histidine kinase CreC [Motilimonas sp. 1_MG-2023]|uniref:two-component system sensor histidine kinase CreC n=1 Tax=Motilimonas sp. 1_MG-2023 TaxID=3062672 RepID=UPI0026E2BF93|nr:two-component system sensor histidine kinase CreC [Motilimonas sp. 1_MG-2023]MDO6527950.1 two-component system sensor histidine kinase CreC [Motilimonas sp. 1_MG-2023]
MKLPKISFRLRLFLFFFLLIGVGLSLQLNVLTSELKPGLRQATEESMVDAANLLAEIATAEFVRGELANGEFDRAFKAFKQRELNAQIWTKAKTESLLRVYITDSRGVVVYHSEGRDIGTSYYRWNDVQRTLNGQYGARSTEAVKGDPLTSEMYVAAPILVGEQVIGVLTLIKPNLSLQPFLEVSRDKVERFGMVLILLAVLLGLAVSYWLTGSIRKLRDYAVAVSQGKEAVAVPQFSDIELEHLAQAMAHMRVQLEGKNYVEQYIHSLTHEMKSPVAAIKGAAELLEQGLPPADQAHFIGNIKNESVRVEILINQLLALAALENQQGLNNIVAVDLGQLALAVVERLDLSLKEKQLTVNIQGTGSVEGDAFLLGQAIENLMTNAIDFSPVGAEISLTIGAKSDHIFLKVADQGPGLPDYALARVFERFYSLPRPHTGKKSSGLGLSFVQQICYLHQAKCSLKNGEQGAIAQLTLPFTQPK